MKIILIDANNVLFRFGWVFRNLQTIESKPTGAVYGFIDCLLRLKKAHPTAKFVVCWDGPDYKTKGWRTKLFRDYKSNRTPSKDKPEDVQRIYEQIPDIKRLLDYIGVSQVCVNEVEADDVIGVFCGRYSEQRDVPELLIYSSDKDYLQLMDLGVKLIRDIDKKDKLRPETVKDVQKRFRCTPAQLLMVRALCGDPSDNIPNVRRGIGEVTAAAMVAAGVDPSFANFLTHHTHIRSQFEGLGAVWGIAHKNYRIMRILRSYSDQELTPTQRNELGLNVIRTMTELTIHDWGTNFPRRSYKHMLELFSELELKEAMDKRHSIFNVQKI